MVLTCGLFQAIYDVSVRFQVREAGKGDEQHNVVCMCVHARAQSIIKSLKSILKEKKQQP